MICEQPLGKIIIFATLSKKRGQLKERIYMAEHNNPENWDMAKLVLQRNDEAIRFSETKAALLLTFIGVLFTIAIDKVEYFQEYTASTNSLGRNLLATSGIVIFLGIIVVTIASIYAIFPRLYAPKEFSVFFFGNYKTSTESESITAFSKLTNAEKMEHIITEIYTTSTIAGRKFRGVQVALAGTILVFVGFIMVCITLYIW